MKIDLDDQTKFIVKKLGKKFKPAVLPDDIERGPVGMCFDWSALQCARSYPKYDYVEGIASDPEQPEKWRLHAWLTDGKHAFDPTWQATDFKGKQYPVPSTYIGIVMPMHQVLAFMKLTGYQGVLGNRHRAPEVVQAILNADLPSDLQDRQFVLP